MSNKMDENIEVIEINNGDLVIQNRETQAVAHVGNKIEENAIQCLRDVLNGADMSGWDLSEDEIFITDDDFMIHFSSGAYKLWDKEAIENHLYRAEEEEQDRVLYEAEALMERLHEDRLWHESENEPWL